MISELEGWLHTDTQKEAFKSLEKLDEILSLIPTDVYQWKWALIVLHNCAQAFMVLALEGTNQVEVVKNRKEYAECLNKLSQGEEMDDEMKKKLSSTQLDYFLNLYSKIKDTNNTPFLWRKNEFQSTDEQDDAMALLNEYRNEFIHFSPGSWGIELSGIPRICASAMDVIRFMINNGNFMYQFSDAEKVRIQDLITSIDQKFGAVGYGK